jgi:hypothetical protein
VRRRDAEQAIRRGCWNIAAHVAAHRLPKGFEVVRICRAGMHRFAPRRRRKLALLLIAHSGKSFIL